MMELQQEEGFNPLAGCLPIFLQIPVFIALFHVLRHLSNSADAAAGAYQRTADALRLHARPRRRAPPRRSCSGRRWPASFRDTAATITTAWAATSRPTRIVRSSWCSSARRPRYMTQLLVRRATRPRRRTGRPRRAEADAVRHPVRLAGLGLSSSRSVCCSTGSPATLWTMGQQLYINRFHPHTPDASTVGAGKRWRRSRAKPVGARAPDAPAGRRRPQRTAPARR